MTITAEMQKQILGITIGVFNMPAGGTWLTNFADYTTKVQNDWSLTDDEAMQELTRALVLSPDFDKIMAGKVTAEAQALVILGHFGLEGNADLLASTTSAIEGFGNENVDGKMASLIWGYTKGLMQDNAVRAQYPEAAALMDNKLIVAERVSATDPVTQTEVGALSGYFNGVTSDTIPETSATGKTFTLTTGTDNVTGTSGNDTINASTGLSADGLNAIATTNALDKIDGGAGIDTLNIENTDGKNTLTGTVTNVENLTFVGAGNVNKNFGVDVTSFSGTVTLSQTKDTDVSLSNVTGQTLALNKVAPNTVLTAALGATQTSVTLSNAAAVGAASFSVAGAKLDTVNLTTDKTAGALTVADTGNTTKTVNITASGTAAVTVDSTALENVKISGAGAVTLTAGTAPSKTLDASGSTGGVTYAEDLVAQQFTGSSAKDTVQFGATTKAQTLGAGDDAVTMSVAALGTGGSIDGGEGTDTISLSAANIATATSNATLGAAFQASISNFDKLGVGTTGAATTVDAQYIDGITYLVSAGTAGANTLTVNNMAGNSTFEMTALAAANVALNLKDNTGTADVMNLKFSATDGFTSSAAITAAGVETLNITTADTDTTAPTTVFTAPITAAAVKSVVVAGNVGIDLTGLNATTLTSFDASGVTATGVAGAVTLVTGNLAADATIKGGAGNDVLNASAALTKTVNIDGGAGDDTITGSTSKVNTLTGGDGNDTIVGGSAADTISGGAGNDTITSGAGLDIVDVGAGDDKFVVTANANGNTYASITGMGKGDKIDFIDGTAAGTFTTAKIVLAGTAAFADYLSAAAASTAATTGDNGLITWFQYGGDTYLVEDKSTAATFTEGTDQVVKLVGLIDLSTATIDGAATNVLTLG